MGRGEKTLTITRNVMMQQTKCFTTAVNCNKSQFHLLPATFLFMILPFSLISPSLSFRAFFPVEKSQEVVRLLFISGKTENGHQDNLKSLVKNPNRLSSNLKKKTGRSRVLVHCQIFPSLQKLTETAKEEFYMSILKSED